MKIQTKNKLILAVSVFLLASSQTNLLQAADESSSSQSASSYKPSDQNYPPPPGGWVGTMDNIDKQEQQKDAAKIQKSTSQSSAQQRGAAMIQQPQSAEGYGRPGYNTPGYAPRRPYEGRNYGRGGNRPSFSGPWDSGRGGNSMPWNSGRGGSGPSFSGPWDGGRGGNSMPWNSGRGGNGPSFSGPWDGGRGGRSMPWDSGRGGRSMPWSDSGRGGWMDKDRFANRWDDMLNAPSDMGEMPGGFTAPSVSVPNPVDVGDEFQDATRDAPDQMRNVYDDNRRSE